MARCCRKTVTGHKCKAKARVGKKTCAHHGARARGRCALPRRRRARPAAKRRPARRPAKKRRSAASEARGRLWGAYRKVRGGYFKAKREGDRVGVRETTEILTDIWHQLGRSGKPKCLSVRVR